MRFASAVTVAAAIAGAPLVVSAQGPQMQGGEFIGAVRCAAYESLPVFASHSKDLGRARVLLNAELRRQPADVAARAQAEVRAVAERAQAVSSVEDLVSLRQERASACAGSGALLAAAGHGAA